MVLEKGVFIHPAATQPLIEWTWMPLRAVSSHVKYTARVVGCEVRIVNILHFFGLSLQITALVKSLVTFIPHKLGNILGMTLACSHYGGIRTLIKHLYDILFLSPYHLQNVLSHYRLLNIVLKYVSNKASNKASSNYITLNIEIFITLSLVRKLYSCSISKYISE